MIPIVRFWITSSYPDGKPVGLRGQYGDSGADVLLYDINQHDGLWKSYLWIHLETDPDAHARIQIAAHSDLFQCLAATENHAQAEVEAEMTKANHD
jgi:hypothetical protein